MLGPVRARGTGEGAGVRRLPTHHSAQVRLFLAVCVAGLACGMLLAGPILTLTDGREIKGVDLRRDGEIFIVALADGSSLPVPRAAVTKLEWTGQGGGRREAGSSCQHRDGEDGRGAAGI